ncbi:MAG TPA: hypothetical protein VLD58_16135 [Gemmatimonadales bacterium]|nr:hypothetical protein [Gemmatimonadales bacterium]
MFGPLEDWLKRLEVRLNRPLFHLEPAAAFWSLYQDPAGPLTGAPPSLTRASAAPCDLLIAITTYNRAESCARLLAALPETLAQAGRSLRLHLVVLQDGPDGDYAAAQALAATLFGERLTWLTARERLGKRGYWKAYQTLFLAAESLRPAHALFLQDDLEFEPSFLGECYRRWEALAGDAGRRVLYLFASDDDEPEGRWVKFRREEARAGARLTRWFDLQGYFVDRAFFDLLRYRMFAVSDRRWLKQPYSSGVGEQLTRRLFPRASVYQAHPSLVYHGAHASEMNPEARSARSLDNRPAPSPRD